MNSKINNYVNELFEPYRETKSIEDIKNDLLCDLNERFEELVSQGKSEEQAISETLDSIGDIDELLQDTINLTHKLERKLSFKGGDFKNSDLKNSILKDSKFSGSSVKDADFSGSDLTASVFSASDLKRINFHKANLTDCKFYASDIKGGKFKETILVRTHFDTSN